MRKTNKRIDLKKVYCFDNINVEIKLLYISKDNDNYKELLDSVFDKKYKIISLHDILYRIKTLFKECDEQYLEVKIYNNQLIEAIIYEKEILKNYISTSYYSNIDFTFSFDSENKEYSITTKPNEKLPYFMIKKVIDEKLEELITLEKFKGKKLLNNEEKYICFLYNLFYNEMPNFMNSDTLKKVQIMIYLLQEQKINMKKTYSFMIKEYPISIELEKLISNLRPIKKFNERDYYTVITESDMKKIKQMGSEILMYTEENNLKQIEVLEKLFQIAYLRKYGKYQPNKEMQYSEKEFLDGEVLLRQR